MSIIRAVARVDRCGVGGGGDMNQIISPALARRRLLQGGAALVFAFSVDPVDSLPPPGPGPVGRR